MHLGMFFGLFVCISDHTKPEGYIALSPEAWSLISNLNSHDQYVVLVILSKIKCKKIKKAQV